MLASDRHGEQSIVMTGQSPQYYLKLGMSGLSNVKTLVRFERQYKDLLYEISMK